MTAARPSPPARWLRPAAALVGASAILVVAPARAQLLDRYFPAQIWGVDDQPGVTVLSRERGEYADPGLRAGNVVVRPQVAGGIGYNDNLLGTQSGVSSPFWRTDASVQAYTDWNRNGIAAFIGTDDRRFFDRPDQNETNWRAQLAGKYEIGRDVAGLSYRHVATHQEPGDLDSASFDRPLAYDVDNVRASYQFTLPVLTLTPAFDYFRYRFSDASLRGQPVIQRQRDRDQYQGELTATYALTPGGTNLVAVVRGTQVNYTTSVGGYRNADTTGYSALAGIDYPGAGPWRYRALVGYQVRDFERTYKTRSAPIAEAAVSWTPQALTTISGSLTRTIEDAADEDPAGYTYLRSRLSIDHELRRNLILRGYVGFDTADYLQSDRTQSLYRTGLSATYLMNRYARLVASYDFLDGRRTGIAFNPANSAFGNGSYTRNTVLLQLQLGRFDPFN